MRNDEMSEHCLCDKCHGYDCGADEPKEVTARPDPLEVLEKWRHRSNSDSLKCKFAGNTFDWKTQFIKEAAFIKKLKSNPDAVIKRGKEEGWLK